jgi:hypothetical protein
MLPLLPALLGLLILLAAPVPLLPGLTFNNAPEVYLPPGGDAVRFERELRRQFPEDQVVLALFEGDGLWQAETLRRLDRAVDQLAGNSLVERVLGVTSVDHIGGSDGVFEVGPLVAVGADGAEGAVADRRARAVADPIAAGRLVAEDGSAYALVVRARGIADSRQSMNLEAAVRQAVRSVGLEKKLVAVTGQVALDAAEFRAMMRDSLRFLPITAVLALGFLGWLFRRWLAVGAAVLVFAATIPASLAVLAAWNQPYTLIHSMVAPLLAGLGVALLIHLFNALAYAGRRGLSGRQRMERALGEVARPARLTTVTTAAGLASLGFSPIPPVRSFGLVTALGVVLLYIVAIRLLPALLVRWDRRPWPQPPGQRWLEGVVRRLARWGMRRPGAVLAAFALGLVVGLPFLGELKTETDLYRFFAEDHPLTQSTRKVETTLSGVTRLEVVLTGKARDAFKEPANLRRVAAFQDWAEGLPEVAYTLSPADFVREMNWAFRGEAPAFRKVPRDERLLAQYLLVYDGRDMFDFVDRDFRRLRIAMALNVHGANAIQGVIGQLRERLRRAFGDATEWRVAGTGRLFADQEDLLVAGQLRSLLAALAIIGGILTLAWRSVSAAGLALIPSFSPVVLIFILMGALGIWLDMATALIASVAIGIAVDDTIHFYQGYRDRRRRGRGVTLALLRSYRQAGKAVTATTLTLGVMFLVLTLSDFLPIATFGLLSAAGMGAAWLFDLLLVPALIMAGQALRLRHPGK